MRSTREDSDWESVNVPWGELERDPDVGTDPEPPDGNLSVTDDDGSVSSDEELSGYSPPQRRSLTPEGARPCRCRACRRPPSPLDPWRPPSPPELWGAPCRCPACRRSPSPPDPRGPPCRCPACWRPPSPSESSGLPSSPESSRPPSPESSRPSSPLGPRIPASPRSPASSSRSGFSRPIGGIPSGASSSGRSSLGSSAAHSAPRFPSPPSPSPMQRVRDWLHAFDGEFDENGRYPTYVYTIHPSTMDSNSDQDESGSSGGSERSSRTGKRKRSLSPDNQSPKAKRPTPTD